MDSTIQDEMENVDLLRFTPELLISILKYLCTRDITSLQCCSSTHYEAFRCFAWESICLRLASLSQTNILQGKRLESLKFTKVLRLGERYLDNDDQDAVVIDKVVDCNYRMLLQHCNPVTLKLGSNVESRGLVAKHVELVCSMTNLVNLDIRRCSPLNENYDNGYVEVICESLLQLKQLKLIGLELEDQDVASLHKLHKLEELDLSFNQKLTDNTLHSVSLLRYLKSLQIYGCCGFTVKGFSYIDGKLTALEKLNVGFCKICDENNMYLSHMKMLKILILGFNDKLNDEALRSIGKLENLAHLEFSDSFSATDEGISHLSPLSKLQCLRFKHMPGLTFENFPHYKNLRTLIIDNGGVNDAGAWCIAQNSSLEILILDANFPLTNEGYLHLCLLVNLVYLSIARCLFINDRALKNGKEINLPPALKKLKVDGTLISKECAAYIHDETSLDITGNRGDHEPDDWHFPNTSYSYNFNHGKKLP